MIDNTAFNSLNDFGIIDRDMYVLVRAKSLASRAITTCVKLGTVQIKGLQDIFWWIHDHQTPNQLLIDTKFGQVARRAAKTGKRMEKERAETDTNVSGIGKFKADTEFG